MPQSFISRLKFCIPLTERFLLGSALVKALVIFIGDKLAVAPVARATPLFLPRPEIIYINVVHYSAPPRTYLLRATPLFRPLWRHCVLEMKK